MRLPMGQPTTNDTSVLLREPVGDALRRMTVPMCYGIIALISFHLVDTYFIALLGTQQLAALAFTLPVAMLISALGIGLGIGTTAIVAHDIGAGNRATAARMVTHSMLLVIAVTAIVSTAGLLTIEPLFRGNGCFTGVVGTDRTVYACLVSGRGLFDGTHGRQRSNPGDR